MEAIKKTYDVQIICGVSIEAKDGTESINGRERTCFTPTDVKQSAIFENRPKSPHEDPYCLLACDSVSATIHGRNVTFAISRPQSRRQIRLKTITCASEPDFPGNAVGFAASVVIPDINCETKEEAIAMAESVARENVRIQLSPVNRKDWKYTCDYKVFTAEITNNE